MNDDKVRLGGLWKNTSRNGTTYLSGRFGMAKLLIFKNDDKRSENAPDYTLYIAPDERPKDSAPGQETDQRAARADPENVPF